jgi:hypothetical protein
MTSALGFFDFRGPDFYSSILTTLSSSSGGQKIKIYLIFFKQNKK